MQIGRITGLTEPHDWDSTDDDQVTIIADYSGPATSVAGLVTRDQILGYPNDDEPVVPVILTSEPRATGYYRPVTSAVRTDLFARMRGLLKDYTIQLRRVSGFSIPMMESIVNGALLTNVVGGLSGDMQYFVAVPSAAVEFFYGPGGSFLSRSTADGSLLWFTGGLVSGLARYYVPPASFYVGACTFQQGSPLTTVVGRMIQPDLVNWSLSNGLVKITPSATAGRLDVAHWKGSAWSAAKTYKIVETANANTVTAWQSVTVLRNSPETAVIRLSATLSGIGINWGRIIVDVAIRRGDNLARCFLSSDSQGTWQIARNATEAATAVTTGGIVAGALRATVNDADSNRYFLASYQAATTLDLVNGKITQNAVSNTFDFAIGSEIGGTLANSNDTAASLAKQYLAAQDEEQRVVAR